MVKVSRIEQDSIAESLGIQAGTELLTVNARPLADFLDWEFLTADEEILIEARLPGGEQVIYEIERLDGEPLGISLEPPTVRRCANRCEFCFIEGLPAGLRKPLYIRDDDYRLSFAYGNFSNTGCRRSTSPSTPRTTRRARFCSTTPAFPTSRPSFRGLPRVEFSFIAKW